MITKLKNKIRRYFGFSSAETNGLLVLIPMILIILLIPSLLRRVLESRHEDISFRDQQILQTWLAESRNKLKPSEQKKPVSTGPFNPNHISSEQWQSLGFRKRIAQRIINYRQKGGQFRKIEDLTKIYGINKHLVTSYGHLMTFPKPKKLKLPKASQKVIGATTPNKPIPKVDLNLADTAQLKSIRGIGPVLSSRIVKYREALGGFYSLKQLQEVYGIKEEVYDRLKQSFYTQQHTQKKINLNVDSIQSLVKHPYLSYPVSRAIVKYRNQHGNYQSIEDLKKVHLVSDSLFQKIKPYLKTSSSE